MVRETMTSRQRILAAINLEPYDRVPVAPLITPSFPLRRKGMHTRDAYLQDPQLGLQAMLDLCDEVGGWDGVVEGTAFPGIPPQSSMYHLGRWYVTTMIYPGVDRRISDDSSPQFTEHETITAQDYDEILRTGWREFMEKNSARVVGTPSPPLEARIPAAKARSQDFLKQKAAWEKKGAVMLNSSATMDPQMYLCLLRTLPQFVMDLRRRPQKVKAVLDAWIDEYAAVFLAAARSAMPVSENGLPGIFMACERGSGTYFSLKVFEEFVWPYIKKLVETWWQAGFLTTLHFDTDWTRNMPYLLQLPRKSCIVELDSTTDIFRAKEILGDHLCIMGDVPPQLSAYGTPQEMQAYCKKLIDVVGKGTGFILSTGCEQPPDTRYENFKAMIDTAKTYYPYS